MRGLYLALFTGILSGCLIAPAHAGSRPHHFVRQVDQLVRQHFLTLPHAQANWERQLNDLLNTQYADLEHLYPDLQAALHDLEDPYTRLIHPRQVLASETSVGVGLHLTRDPQTSNTIVISAVPGSPAFEGGLRPGDRLKTVDGQSVQTLSLDDVISRICGPQASTLELTWQRGQQSLSASFRRRLQTGTNGFQKDPAVAGPIGYIQLTEFSESSHAVVKDAIQSLERGSVVGYILDLRFNAGGSLQASADIADLWLDQGTIVSLLDREGNVIPVRATPTVLTTKPLIILVNQGSASASEVLAGSLQHHGRATLVGQPTFGKGTVQANYQLDGDIGLVITVAHYQLPDGSKLDHQGLTPDVNSEWSEADWSRLSSNGGRLSSLDDPQYQAAISRLMSLISGSERP